MVTFVASCFYDFLYLISCYLTYMQVFILFSVTVSLLLEVVALAVLKGISSYNVFTDLYLKKLSVVY